MQAINKTITLKQPVELCTSGTGMWSSKKWHPVLVKKLSLHCYVDSPDDQPDFGELRVYFDKRTWNESTDGLIYLDPGFLRNLKAFVKNSHCGKGSSIGIGYSEYMMQGDDYVSLDVDAGFIACWDQLAQKVGRNHLALVKNPGKGASKYHKYHVHYAFPEAKTQFSQPVTSLTDAKLLANKGISSASNGYQIIMEDNANIVYIRFCRNGVWGRWRLGKDYTGKGKLPDRSTRSRSNPAMSTTTKVALGALLVAGAGGAAWYFTKKKPA